MENQNLLLEMKGIRKSFSGVQVLADVGISVKRGSVHGLMGENGAGKSTLMKILLGLYAADSGTIIFKGEILERFTVSDALYKGITMIHQELMSVPNMTVADNIFLGKEITAKGFVREREQFEQLGAFFAELGVRISPKARMKDLSTAQIQLVEMVKAMTYNADLIIMDEPTSALSETEVDNMITIVKNLRERGVSIIYITHKLNELFKIADEVTVLRDGQNVVTKPVCELDQRSLIKYMVGRELNVLYPEKHSTKGEELLRVENFSREGESSNINFTVNAGEILGFAGLMGAGRSELLNSVFGASKAYSGNVYIKGTKVNLSCPNTAIYNGMGLVTEDRKLTGTFAPLTLSDNMVMPSFESYTKAGFINDSKITADCLVQKEKMGIKATSIAQVINNLSGGNQQKVLLARWMMREDVEILIVDEPTRGIDVMAKSEIHETLFRLVEQGKAIVLISSEMQEIIGMSDRVLVMCEGRIAAELIGPEITQENIMKNATAFRGDYAG